MIRSFHPGERDLAPQPPVQLHNHGICTCATFVGFVKKQLLVWALIALVGGSALQTVVNYQIIKYQVRQALSAGRTQ